MINHWSRSELSLKVLASVSSVLSLLALGPLVLMRSDFHRRPFGTGSNSRICPLSLSRLGISVRHVNILAEVIEKTGVDMCPERAYSLSPGPLMLQHLRDSGIPPSIRGPILLGPAAVPRFRLSGQPSSRTIRRTPGLLCITQCYFLTKDGGGTGVFAATERPSWEGLTGTGSTISSGIL